MMEIDTERLRELYWDRGLSQREIAKLFGVSQKTIHNWMKRFNIPRRQFNRPDITKEVLEDLYLNKKLSMPQIAKKLNSTYDTIRKKMKKFGIKVRSMSEAKMKYYKRPFSGNPIEKAYLLGLRAGDISATKACKQISIMVGSTHLAQLEMFKKAFKNYSFINAHITRIKDGRKAIAMYCRLDKSFSFLLKKPKRIPKWVLDDINCFYSFLAGYSDSEACWYLYKSGDRFNARFQITSGDNIILHQICKKLTKLGFKTHLRLAHKKGYQKTFGKYNRDMYCLYINRKEDVKKLAEVLLNFSHHLEKIWKMRFIAQNIGKDWVLVKDEITQFKNRVKETTLNKSSIQPQQFLLNAMSSEDEYLLKIFFQDYRQ